MKYAVFAWPALLTGFLLMPMNNPVQAQQARTEKISRFSGKPLPRFESLRYSAVHGRKGPSLDHPIVWRYERTGLPVMIVRETHGWRRVRDMDGDEVWMQARMLSSARTAVVVRETRLYNRPETDSPARARLAPALIAELDQCANGWCRIRVQRRIGWVACAALRATDIS